MKKQPEKCKTGPQMGKTKCKEERQTEDYFDKSSQGSEWQHSWWNREVSPRQAYGDIYTTGPVWCLTAQQECKMLEVTLHICDNMSLLL